jgi:nitroimidazol reductase NimA-like FMN-containing flavoprotein (pyridoxamine 5'-phosphate oxidase superfamily)
MQRKIEDLTTEECMTLLGQESVGRLAFVDAEGPVAVPVNFGLAGTLILFRLEPDSHLRAAVDAPVAFEVDHTDADTGSGWSVLVRGKADEVDLDDVPELLRLMAGLPRPWAEGVHSVWVTITPRKVTGRRLTTRALGDVS